MTSHLLRFGEAAFEIGDSGIDREPLGERYFALLRAFVADTHATCAFHRDRLDRAGIDAGVVESFDHFARIPFLGPAEVNAVPDVFLLPEALSLRDGLTRLPEEDRIARKFLTSSSTGVPKGAYYTRSDWMAATCFGSRLTEPDELPRFARLLNCFHAGHVAGKLFEDIFARQGCFVENNHHTNTSTEALLRQLSLGLAAMGGFNAIALPPWRPAQVAGHKGTTLDVLLNEDVDNLIGDRIETLVTGGAPFSPDHRIKDRTWEANELAGKPHARFLHTYGSAEVGIAAASCRHDGDGLHLLQGAIYTEIIDEHTGEHVESGEAGLVVFTGLKHGSRFLRYIVGDQATFIAEACACGRSSPRIRDIERVLEKERLLAGCAAGGY